MKIIPIYPQTERTKRCVISLGVGKPVFKLTLQRLGESLKRVGFDGDYLYWDESLPSGCPNQFDAPFAFKSYCFIKAKELGYEQVLWIDAPCVAIRNLAPVFRSIEQHGYVFFNNNYGQMMGQWSSDDALAMNNISREEALAMPEIPCSVLGLNLRSDLASNFLDGWHQIMTDGITVKGIKEKSKLGMNIRRSFGIINPEFHKIHVYVDIDATKLLLVLLRTDWECSLIQTILRIFIIRRSPLNVTP